MEMSKKEKINKVIEMRINGAKAAEIAKALDMKIQTVNYYLQKNKIYRKKLFDDLSPEEKQEICKLYQDGKWELIFEKFPIMTKQRVYRLASDMKIRKNQHIWTEKEEQILKDNINLSYKEISKLLNHKRTISSIRSKALKMNLGRSREQIEWTSEEKAIMENYYSVLPIDKIEQMLPNRTHNAILDFAATQKIKSYHRLNERYFNEQEKFIIDNFQCMTDQEIADCLNKPVRSVQDKRRKLGLYYFNIDYSGYENIAKFLRGHIQSWKTQSMAKCEYKCVLTGSKDFEIHHLYSFNTILKEVFAQLTSLKVLKSTKLEDYSKEELDNILLVFHGIHDKYPLGVCVRKDLHKLFHDIYGSGANTEEQWNKFVQDYNNKGN